MAEDTATLLKAHFAIYKKTFQPSSVCKAEQWHYVWTMLELDAGNSIPQWNPYQGAS